MFTEQGKFSTIPKMGRKSVALLLKRDNPSLLITNLHWEILFTRPKISANSFLFQYVDSSLTQKALFKLMIEF